LRREFAFFTEEIEDALSSTPGAVLTTIPRAEAITAAKIFSGIGDINQFKSADQVVCYCRLIPIHQVLSLQPGIG